MTYRMSEQDAPIARPEIRKISHADIRDAISLGLADFNAVPTFAVFLCAIYPIVGLLIGAAIFNFDIIPLLFPLVSGFALVGPFAAVGLYGISRARERGEPVGWQSALGVLRSPAIGSILALGAFLAAILLVWLATAYALYTSILGAEMPATLAEFAHQVFMTPEGARLILVGNSVGAGFALVAFAISLVSFPMLVDRPVGAPMAVATSLRAFANNPLVLLQWGVIAASALALGSVPFLLGLAVVIPVLGHATWHLYRKLVVY